MLHGIDPAHIYDQTNRVCVAQVHLFCYAATVLGWFMMSCARSTEVQPQQTDLGLVTCVNKQTTRIVQDGFSHDIKGQATN
jgi:hypothetical protein